MKKANKILSVFLSLMMVFSILPITSSAAYYGEVVYRCPHCGNSFGSLSGGLCGGYVVDVQYPTDYEDGWAKGVCIQYWGYDAGTHRVEYYEILPSCRGNHDCYMEYTYSIEGTPESCGSILCEYYSCYANGCSYGYTIEYPLSHNYYTVETKPTCTTDGIKYEQCKVCNKKENETILPSIGHNYYTVETKPTCTTDGVRYQQCENCNEQINKTFLPATGHTLTWHTLSVATCQTDGVAHGYCDNCDYYEVETISKTDHADNNGDGECDTCDLVLCDHDCHKGGFAGFIWMITNFFNRLFGSNKTCSCGVAHY